MLQTLAEMGLVKIPLRQRVGIALLRLSRLGRRKADRPAVSVADFAKLADSFKQIVGGLRQIYQSQGELARHVSAEREKALTAIDALSKRLDAITEVDIFVYKKSDGFRLEKNHPADACWDLTAIADTTIGAGQRGLIDTGLIIAIPFHWEAQIRGRSGINANLASKPSKARNISAIQSAQAKGEVPPDPDCFPSHITTHIGTCDAGYRDYYRVVLENGNDHPVVIKRGDRVAQLAIRLKPIKERVVYVDTPEDLPASDGRGANAFASSGTNGAIKAE
jgi:dUTP pyrophosphatase